MTFKVNRFGWVTLMTLFVWFLSGCVSVNDSKTVSNKVSSALVLRDSGSITFSDVKTYHVTKGIRVTGIIKKNSAHLRQLTIPGHLHIALKGPSGEIKEIVEANTRRQHGNSRIWFFDGTLKKSVLEKDAIEVQYHVHSNKNK